MKDATGELSMTAIAVVAIAAIGVVFTTLIWPSIKNNITRSTRCSQIIGPAETCDASAATCKFYYCEGEGDNINCDKTVVCPNQQ